MKPKSKRRAKAIATTMKHATRLRDDYGPYKAPPSETRAFERAVYRLMDAARRVGQIEAEEAIKQFVAEDRPRNGLDKGARV